MDVKINYNTRSKLGSVAVVYARYSSHSQGEQSIDGQLAAARAYAEAKGYTIIHEYVDRAQTGRNDNRDEFQQMLSDCQQKNFQIIIVWKVDRFGRNREEITFNKYRAKKYGVRVEYVAENLPDSPEGVILESVLEGMAEYYSLQLSQNIKRGYRENAKKAKYCGGRVPLGYKLSAEKKFEINPETAPLVSRIYRMYAEGQTITEIISELNAEGLRTSEGMPFTKNSLRTVLRNEKYIGEFVYKRGTDEEIRIEGGTPAIVDKDTFYKVQKLMQVNQKAPAHKWSRADYILSDKLFCGTCGSKMIGESGTSHTGSKYNYYLCVAHKSKKKTCSRKAVKQDLIENYVLDSIRAMIMDDDMIRWITDCVWEYYQQQDESKEKMESIVKQLSDVDKAITNLSRAIEQGLPLNDVITARIDALGAQRTALSKALAEAKLDTGFQLTRDHIQFFLEQFRNMDFNDRECQKRLVDVFVNSIYVYEDELVLTFNYGGDKSQIHFKEIESMREDVGFGYRASCSTKTRAAELVVFANVFVLTIKMPRK